jgi:hypothetical protein
MWDRYQQDLRRAVRKSSGREKGLLVANYEAEREIYGTSSLTLSTLREGVKDIGPPDQARQFHTTLEAQERLSVYITNIQTRYLQLRERLTFLYGIFFVLKQYQFEENLLNDISGGRGKRATALRQRIVSNSHRLLLGDITLDEEGEYVHVRVSDTGKEVAFKTIETIQDKTLLLKTKIEVARGFMEETAIHLKAYEAYLDGIEGELRELIRSAQRLLYDVDSDSWEEFREFLAQGDDDFLRLIEALPDYDALAIDEDAYCEEEDVLLSDGEWCRRRQFLSEL